MRIKVTMFLTILIAFFISLISNASEYRTNLSDDSENVLIAQADGNDLDMGYRGRPQKAKGKKFRRYEKFRQRKLLELLELNDNQKDKLLPMMEKIRNEGHQLMDEKIELIDNLSKELIQSNPDDLKINEHINKILVLNEKHERIRNKLLQNVKQLLSPVQVGKLIIFEERFHQRAMEKIFDSHRRMEFRPDSGRIKRERNR
ncbi:MAG: hypothetical protein U9N54_08085 [candidate division Zixibacteria bacterium]|nr:hypothetical protein [candidate division Zixibacteria bacterium]